MPRVGQSSVDDYDVFKTLGVKNISEELRSSKDNIWRALYMLKK